MVGKNTCKIQVKIPSYCFAISGCNP